MSRSLSASAGALALCGLCAAHPALAGASADPAPTAPEVVVTASRLDLLATAETASQGAVTKAELDLRPAYRIGQLLEATPGLAVTVHSGEAKANLYYVRGFLLDHGTDIALSVDAMPINRPTNAHGQGYADLNFLTPQLLGGVDFGKGPFYASVGDFGAVAYDRLKLVDTLPNQVEVDAGTLGDEEAFVGGTHRFASGDRLIAAADYAHLDGPWDHPDNFHKIVGALRYLHGAPDDGYSLTALYYWGHSNLTTDQPLRAVQEGLIGPYGTLDPSDGARSERFSLSGRYAAKARAWTFDASAYAIKSSMTLWNDYTHLLADPVEGDQEQQGETRDTAGGQAAFTYRLDLGPVRSETTVGLQGRYDDVYVDRRHTHDRQALGYCEADGDGGTAAVAAVDGACDADRVRIGDLALYGQTTVHWTRWLRTVVGLREDDQHAFDHSFVQAVTEHADQALFQPKGSLILGPWWRTEAYVSAGRGFHSNDVRGVFQTVEIEGVPTAAGRTPLLSAATAYEAGLRSDLLRGLYTQLAVFQEDFRSELAYDQDEGQDEASAPSRRYGLELSAQYHPRPWLELNTDLSWTQTRYTGADLGAFGLDGPFIAGAPDFIGAFGVLLTPPGPWSGGLQWRRLGRYGVSDGDAFPQDRGYSEVSLQGGYRVNAWLRLRAEVFNLGDTHANASAGYYVSRLPGEPAEGVADRQDHPLEPRSARLGLTALF